ncbi:MAG TPA: carboxylesterase family protein [Sphingopyxis sp.]|nr:carboxylesterase family protein [Sphingopyxis sp.]HMP43692.1 carboxylesterase family protein [Sphingopyxis sp.]HMQ17654.1 carboxylesterase family protein [Sphingopyxis sp.]
MPIVSTSAGKLRGIRLGDGLLAFRGIPYAAAPVGPLRWRPPAPVDPWSGVRDAQAFGADAVQVSGIRESRAPGMSEDCLFLNVWAPEEAREGGWPVIVWSGGGGFNTGGGAFAVEDMSRLAARGAVVVSFNYRLGIFGFLAHRALTAESDTGSSGNYGLMDHVAALEWVRANIAGFGGDGDRITYMAESSGAAAGLLMLAMTRDRALFDRAILLSPGSVSPLLPLDEAEASAAALAMSADDMRALTAEELLVRSKSLAAPPSNLSVARPLRPIVDGRLVTTDRAYAEGNFAAVPVIIGTNEDEGRFFTRRMAISSLADYSRYLSDSFGRRAGEARALYPAATDADVAAAVAAAYGDVSINHPVDRLARAFARRQPRTFRFVYTYRHGHMQQPPTHAEEAETFLDNRPHVTPADAEMAGLIGRYLLAFAEKGDPSSPEMPGWPAFDAEGEHYLRLDLPLAHGARWRSEHMGFLSEAFDSTS